MVAKSEQAFLEAFHKRTLPRFSHQDHLHLAWVIMRNHGLETGLEMIGDAIRAFAAEQGAANRYHETLTSFWGRIVEHAIKADPEIDQFDAFLAQHPFLLEKDLPLQHWSSQLLWSDQARSNWTLPDLKPLP